MASPGRKGMAIGALDFLMRIEDRLVLGELRFYGVALGLCRTVRVGGRWEAS